MSKANNEFNWTDKVTLQAYFEKLMEELTKANEKRFDELEDKVELRFQLNQTALDKAETATNIRLESMNEFRNAMKDQSNKYLTCTEYETKHQLILEKIDSLQRLSYMLIGALAIVEFLFKFFIK
jgi:predicted nuclease with TOPRIM domain